MKHLDKKYFRYRGDMVARWQAQYPERARILATSELLRLAFLMLGSLLVAIVSGVLTYTAIGRVGIIDWRPFVFAALALFAACIFLRVVWSLIVERKRARQASSS